MICILYLYFDLIDYFALQIIYVIVIGIITLF